MGHGLASERSSSERRPCHVLNYALINLEGRASARPGREESRPSAEIIDLTNKRI